MLDPIRALGIIEGMVMEMSDENKLMADIYMIAHQGRSPTCMDAHPDFEERALEIETMLVESGMISPWGLNTKAAE